MGNNGDKAGVGLGAFAGVFTPSILTILGIILFLRLGFVVGKMGLMKGLVIIALANAISVITSISLSTVATNLRVKGGGDYYLISRTLGLEFGGALGLVLFLAQSVSIGFYCLGFGEGGGRHARHRPCLADPGHRPGRRGLPFRPGLAGRGCGHQVPVRGHGGSGGGPGFLFLGRGRTFQREPFAGQLVRPGWAAFFILGRVRPVLPGGDRLHPGG